MPAYRFFWHYFWPLDFKESNSSPTWNYFSYLPILQALRFVKKLLLFKDLFLLLISIAKREKIFQERENVESLFSLKYERNYFQGHETRYLSQLVVIIKAKNPDQDGLFKHNGLLELAKKIDDTVHETRVRSGLHGNIHFKDVCALTRMSEGRECQKNEFIELSPRMDKIRSGKVNLTFPQFEDPVTETSYFMPAHFGNITTTLINDDSRYALCFVSLAAGGNNL